MKRTRFLSIILLFLFLPGCAPAQPAEIAATTLPVYQFTQAICQNTPLTVTRLVTESVSCLHDYTLQVSQMRRLEAAEAVILSGAGLEGFLEDALVCAQGQIDASQGIPLTQCHSDHEENHGHVHETDPHIWLSPANAALMAQNISDGLCLLYPEHAPVFQTNLANLLAQLKTLQAYGETQLADLRCRELVTFHDGFGYFAQSFDLTVLEAVEEESGSEASARELVHLIELVDAHDLSAIFTETNGSTSAAQIIAAETGAGLYALDMAMAGEDYFTAMYHNIDTVREALG